MVISPTTQHEIVIGIISCLLFAGISKVYSYFSNSVGAWNNRQAVKNLMEMEKSPSLYADKILRRQRQCFGIAAYLACCDLFITQMEWPLTKATKVTLISAAGILCVVAGAYSDRTTEAGVKERIARFRERLKKLEKPSAD